MTLIPFTPGDHEKLRQRLHARNGHRLARHPVAAFQENLLKRWITNEHNQVILYGKLHFRRNEAMTPFFNLASTAMTIQELEASLREAQGELDETLDAVEKIANKVRAVADVLLPEIQSINQTMRQTRMSTETEMKKTLEWLKTVREFFLEKDYEREMDKLKAFIDLCEHIQRLKQNGTLDVVSDLALKMAGGPHEG